MDKALTLIQDLAQLRDWLTDQIELDSEIIETHHFRDYKDFGDYQNIVPYYKFIGNRHDLMRTLHIIVDNQPSGRGIVSRIYNASDICRKYPLTHLELLKYVNYSITA